MYPISVRAFFCTVVQSLSSARCVDQLRIDSRRDPVTISLGSRTESLTKVYPSTYAPMYHHHDVARYCSHMVAEPGPQKHGCLGGQPLDANAVGSRRADWRITARVEQKDAQQTIYEKEYARRVETELPEICDSNLALKDKNSVSSTSAGESSELYFKTKDDYYQDLSEFVTDDAKSQVAEEVMAPVARPYPEYLDVPCTNSIVQTMQKTVEVPQMQYIGKINDVSVVLQYQVPTIRTVQRTVEVPQVRSLDRVADVPVATQRRIPTIQTAQTTVGPLPPQSPDH